MTTLPPPPAGTDPRIQEVLRSVTHLQHRIDLMSALGDPIWSTHTEDQWSPHLEEFKLERRSSFQRSMRLSLPVNRPDHLPSADSAHPLRQPSNLVRIWAGIGNGDETWWWPKATMLVDDLVVNESDGVAIVSVACVSRLKLLKTAFTDTYSIDVGTNFADAILGLIELAIPLDTGLLTVSAASTAWTTPRIDAEIGDDVLALIEELLDAIGWELVEDPLGNIGAMPMRTRDTTGADALWSYADGGIPAQTVSRAVSNRSNVGGVAVFGGNTSVDNPDPTLTVWDLDPTSVTFRDPTADLAFRTERLENEFITSAAQALDAGLSRMRRVGGGGAVTFTCLPNPAMNAGDVVSFGRVAAGVPAGRWTVDSLSLPLNASALMTVTITPSWRPEGDGVIAPPEGTSQTVFSDNFNRPDANLDGDGTNWRETGYSFNLRNNQAVQLAKQNWVTAWWVDPLTSTDHWAQATVGLILNIGDRTGPMIRQDGQGAGFALLAGTDQLVELVRMQGKRPVETLDSWDAGTSLLGAVLRVEAEGTAIVGTVDGAVRCSGTSSRSAAGLRAGMAAWSSGNASPAVDDFSAGVL